MHLPLILQQAIEEEISSLTTQEIIKARKELTADYRNQRKERKKVFMTTRNQRYSYLATRLPATFAALVSVFQELVHRDPSLHVKSLLDLGAGPGTSLWAAIEFFPQMEKVTLVEKDMEMIHLGKKLFAKNPPLFPSIHWEVQDLEKRALFAVHDLVVCSYSLGEFTFQKAKEILLSAFQSTSHMIIIEPGTPMGYSRILEARECLLAAHAHMVAPCPHELPCPLKDGDWCHFSARVERTRLHRQIKQASLGYEDEKFSYLIVSKSKRELPLARVLRDPLKKSGHVGLKLCTPQGIEEKIFSKKEGEIYKKMRDLEWGDSFDN